MYYFVITYEDGNTIDCSCVTSVAYNEYDSSVTVPCNELAEHCFPLQTNLWLHAEQGTLSISGKGIRSIRVEKE